MNIIEKIKRYVKRKFQEGKADEIRIGTIRSMFLSELSTQEIQKIIKEVEEELKKEFIAKQYSPVNDIILKQYIRIIEGLKNNYNARVQKAQEILKKSIKESIKKGNNWEMYALRAFKEIKCNEIWIETEINTTKNALANLQRYKLYKENGDGDIFYRYEGPSPTRSFCKKHYNKIYRLEEIEKLVNDFGQPAYVYCGGYNCKHRWTPVIGKMEGNLFISENWQKKYTTASKNEKKILSNELEFAKKLAKLGYKVEMNYALKDKDNKDTDIIFEGMYAQIKQPISLQLKSLLRQPKSYQADVIIVEIPGELYEEDYKILKYKYKNYILLHPNKRILLFYNNKLEGI